MVVPALCTKVAVPSQPSTSHQSEGQGLLQGNRARGQVRRQLPGSAEALGFIRTAGENLHLILLSEFGINSLRVASIKLRKEIIRCVFSPHSYPLQSEKSERGHQLERRLLINSPITQALQSFWLQSTCLSRNRDLIAVKKKRLDLF